MCIVEECQLQVVVFVQVGGEWKYVVYGIVVDCYGVVVIWCYFGQDLQFVVYVLLGLCCLEMLGLFCDWIGQWIV